MILLLTLTLLIFPLLVSAQDASQVVSVTTGVNICGNEIIESPAEDCEGLNLNGQTCSSLGYTSGTLTCDIACSFITSACVAASASPSLAPRNTLTPVTASPSPLFSPTPSPIVTVSPATVNPLPRPLIALIATLDLDRLTLPDLRPVIQSWVDSWRSSPSVPTLLAKCDINTDATCDLTDLSIILYHVNTSR